MNKFIPKMEIWKIWYIRKLKSDIRGLKKFLRKYPLNKKVRDFHLSTIKVLERQISLIKERIKK